jgi:hypothetical protein
LTITQRRELLSTYADANARVARAYLGRERLFDETLPADPMQLEIGKGLTPEKITYILGWILARLF